MEKKITNAHITPIRLLPGDSSPLVVINTADTRGGEEIHSRGGGGVSPQGFYFFVGLFGLEFDFILSDSHSSKLITSSIDRDCFFESKVFRKLMMSIPQNAGVPS